MKKDEIRKRLRAICRTAHMTRADLAINGEAVDTKPIIAGMVAGMGYASALLDENADDYVSDPGEVIKRLILCATELMGLIEVEREGKEG